MALVHHAYPFDFDPFAQELYPLLKQALASDDPQPLIAFVEARRDRLTERGQIRWHKLTPAQAARSI
jgi:hypothetical protein